jgi:hypothetical protein
MASSSPYLDPPALPISQLLENAKTWKEGFNKPLSLGVPKAVSIITCMVQLFLLHSVLLSCLGL